MTLNGPAANVLAGRRDAVLEALRETRAVLVLPAVVESVYSADVHYPYRTGSNIRYLTGFEEPAAVILSAAGHEDGFTLLVNPRDPVAETWTGRRAGIEGALSDYSADHAYPLDQFEEVVQKHLSGADRLYYGYGTSAAGDRIIPELVHRANGLRPRGGGSPIEMVDAGTILDEMRLFKADEEIAIMRRACEISSDAHVRLMEQIRPGMNEYQAQALIEHAFRDAGCAGPAYGTIAAGGANATVLHYTSNDRELDGGELFLVDAGGEYGGYCADITRTFPIGKSFTPAQARIYDIVLDAQKAAVARVKPGSSHQDVHMTAVRVLCEGLIELGLIDSGVDECIESEAYKTYYMHGTSHWLGMDVHDVGSYKPAGGSRELEPGIVLTVEPGLYIAEDADVPEELRGIGIRVEDDVLVTPGGHDVLTESCPKERGDLEALRAAAV